MSRGAFMEFLDLLQSSEKSLSTGRPQTTLKERLFITLWALANQNSFKEIGDRFNISKGTSYYIVIETCQTICKFLNKFVIWPSTSEAINTNVEKFNYLRGSESFPNVIGCIDGMHIAIPTPSKDQSSYYNRKGFHSLILQAVCNAKGAFIMYSLVGQVGLMMHGYSKEVRLGKTWKMEALKFLQTYTFSATLHIR